MTETFAVFVHADIPQDSPEMTLVPLGMTVKLVFVLADRWPAECMLTLDNSLVDREVSFDPHLPLRRI